MRIILKNTQRRYFKTIISIIFIFPALISVIFINYSLYSFILIELMIVFLYLFTILRYLPAYFKSFKFFIKDDNFEISKGVFFKKRYIIKKRDVIYGVKTTLPLSGFFSLSSVTLRICKGYIFISFFDLAVADKIISLCGEKNDKNQ